MFAWLRRVFGGGGAGGVMQNLAARLAVQGAARMLGYTVAREGGDGVELAIASGYQLVRTGTLSPAAAAAAMGKLKGMNPVLYMSAVDLLQLMGASIMPEADRFSFSGIPPEFWHLASTAYEQGLELGRASKKG